MIEPFEAWVGYVGIVLIVTQLWLKWEAWKYHQRAVTVRGEVLKIFPHSKYTSYFLAYEYGGQRRIAEYRGMPLVPEYKLGETFEVAIDGQDPPDVPLPDKTHAVWFGMGATVDLPGFSWFRLGDALWLGMSIFLITNSFGH